jgi:sporulation protein YlmC with PRC-barrel domain
MKARTSLAAVIALMAFPVFAQDPPASPTEPPAMQNEQPAPATPPAATPPAATEPAPAPTPPSADKQATTPSATPSADVASSDLKKAEDDKKMVSALNSSVDQVEGMDIYDASGKKIAEVDSVLEDSGGEVKGIAIEYGGFLGFGEKGAIVTLDQVKLKDGNLVTELTEDQLPTLPAWND